MASLGLRYPVWREVVGTQVISDPSVFGGIAYRFGGSKVVKKEGGAELPKPNVLPGEVPKDPELLKVLGDNQVTIIDYWAEWCELHEVDAVHRRLQREQPTHQSGQMGRNEVGVEQFKRFCQRPWCPPWTSTARTSA